MRLYTMIRVISLFFILISVTACERSLQVYQAHGILVRIDSQSCTCCGGIVLQVDRDSTDYRVDSIRMFDIKDMLYDQKFPLRIHFDYEEKRSCGNRVFVTLGNFETSS